MQLRFVLGVCRMTPLLGEKKKFPQLSLNLYLPVRLIKAVTCKFDPT